jgi:hypothetical protein
MQNLDKSSRCTLSCEQRRALDVLAVVGPSTVALLIDISGFNTELLTGLILDRLVTVALEQVRADDDQMVGIVRMRITDAGRMALAVRGGWTH